MNFIFSDDMMAAKNMVNVSGYSTAVKTIDLTVWVQILASLFITHVVLGKLFNLLILVLIFNKIRVLIFNKDNNSVQLIL